jgi:hypothetical protein
MQCALAMYMQQRMVTCMLALLGLVCGSTSCVRVGHQLPMQLPPPAPPNESPWPRKSACCACYPSFPARCCCVSEQMTVRTGAQHGEPTAAHDEGTSTLRTKPGSSPAAGGQQVRSVGCTKLVFLHCLAVALLQA